MENGIIYRWLSFVLVFLSLVVVADEAKRLPITIAINKTTYPYQFENNKGEADGLMVDLWKLWAKKQGVDVQFELLNWQQTLNKVKSGEIDIHAGMAKTASREKYFDFTPAFFTQPSYIYLHQSLKSIKRIEQLSPYLIGTVAESSHVDTLTRLYPQLSLKLYPSRTDNYQAALNGDSLAFTDLDHSLGFGQQYTQLERMFPKNYRLFLADIEYVAAVKKGREEFLHWINQGLLKINFTERAQIERKWLGFEKARDVLTLAFSTQLAPYMALSPTGKPQGLFIDFWRLWAEKNNQKIEFLAAEMSQALNYLKQHQADVHIAYPESDSVRTGLKQAHLLYQVNSKVFVSTRFHNITHLQQLKGKTLGVFETAPYKTGLLRDFPDLIIRYFKSIDEMLTAAELGEIDAFIGAEDNIANRLIQTNLQSSYKVLEFPVYHANIYSLVTPESNALAQIIANGFKQISSEEMLALEKQWLPNKTDYFYATSEQTVQLSAEEKQWRLHHPTIRVGFVKNWYPIEFENEQGLFSGINHDVLTLIAKQTGLDFRFIGYDSWPALSQAMQNKDVDLIGSALPSEQRLEKFNFTQPYWHMPWVLLHKQSQGNISSLTAFYGKRLALVKGYALIDEIRQQHPLISIVLVNSADEGLKAVQQQLADGLIEPLGSASALLNKQSLVNLMISPIDELQNNDKVNRYYFMARKDWPALVTIIDKAIAVITEQQRQTIYEQWFKLNINTGFDKATVKRIAIQAVFVVFVVLAFVIVWNRRLYQEIKRRKQLEHAMKELATHDPLTGLANRTFLNERLNNLISFHQRQQLHMAVLFIDIDGFKVINDTYGHDIGDELLVQIAERLQQCVRQSDTLVRFGGDEFVVVLTGLHQPREAAFVADKILTTMKTPFTLSVVTTCMSCSIGIALYPEDGDTATDIIKTADTLMYRVKETGKNNYTFNADF
jgi:diguanylate cyclase (GGDEF)-like protein